MAEQPKNTLRLDGSRGADVARAVEILRAGGLVAIPTETVYGLAALGLDPDAVGAIFEAKGRPAHNPVILHVDSFDAARPLWRSASDADRAALARAASLASRFWPGPLTLVCARSPVVPDAATGGLDKVAVRCPDHPVARAILAAVGEPLAAPSANASGRVSPTTAEHVLETLAGRIQAVIDGGPCRLGLESTVVDVAREAPIVLRPGALPESELRAVLPSLEVREEGRPAHVVREASPGLLARHYAPLVEAVAMASESAIEQAWRGESALLVREPTQSQLSQRLGPRPACAVTESLPDDPAAFARGLYAALYRIERHRPRRALLETPPGGPEWRAIRDRLLRATAPH